MTATLEIEHRRVGRLPLTIPRVALGCGNFGGVGRWIASREVPPQLTTKVFNPMEEGQDRGLDAQRIERQLRSSLERLGVERVDLYLAHEFDPEVPLAETLGVFAQLRAKQRIAAYGVSNFGADQLRAALAAGAPAAIQNSHSLLDRSDDVDVLPLCAERQISYLAFGPLAGAEITRVMR